MLRKLAKKYSLKKTGLEKPYIYIEDLIEVLRTNLITTKKRYFYRRHRILLQLYLQLGSFTANRPQALLNLYYRYIRVTLL